MRTSACAVTCAVLCAVLSGCVIGYGHCLWLQPFTQTLTGVLHFREYPAADGIDHVPVLVLDRTAYLYTPAVSHLCLAADDLQLVGWSEFPPDLPENTHVRVDGSLFEAATGHQHTRFLINVRSIVPTAPSAHSAPHASNAPGPSSAPNAPGAPGVPGVSGAPGAPSAPSPPGPSNPPK